MTEMTNNNDADSVDTALIELGVEERPPRWSWVRPAIEAGLFGMICTLLGVFGYGVYGAALFVGVPFVVGMLGAMLYLRRLDTRVGTFLGASAAGVGAVGVTGLLMLAGGFEGLICLLMASVIWVPFALSGAVSGVVIFAAFSDLTRRLPAIIGLLALLPALMAAEWAVRPEPTVFEVSTSVEIDAPPETVWQHVVSFESLPAPQRWLFHTGIAYPVRAEIVGEGVGAIRYCEFSTGPFVEPITVWDAPRHLAFDVVQNPHPMQEMSIHAHVHAPHLEGTFVSERGEFRLDPLPNQRTRLTGTTWYRHSMSPEWYWRLWSDAIIHEIHARVLEHVATLAERDTLQFKGRQR